MITSLHNLEVYMLIDKKTYLGSPLVDMTAPMLVSSHKFQHFYTSLVGVNQL